MLISNPIKYGVTRAVKVDIGQGVNVGLTFALTDASLLTLSYGAAESVTVGVVHDVTSQTDDFITVTETATGKTMAVIGVQVLPSSTDLSTLLNPDGTVKELGIPVSAPFVPATLTIDDRTPGVIFVTWSGADITTPVPLPPGSTLFSASNPNDLLLWNNTAGASYASLGLNSSGSAMIETDTLGYTGSETFSLRTTAAIAG
jgi:hypothetical protein